MGFDLSWTHVENQLLRELVKQYLGYLLLGLVGVVVGLLLVTLVKLCLWLYAFNLMC